MLGGVGSLPTQSPAYAGFGFGRRMSAPPSFSVVVSTVGRAHLFALARELERRDLLRTIYSGFPWSKLAREQVDRARVKTFPWVRPLVFGVKYLPPALRGGAFDALHTLSLQTLDSYVKATLPDCDIFVGHEGVGLWSGAKAKRQGALYVCDRGCSHIAWQRRILTEEYDRVGLRQPTAPSSMARELEEYDLADHIVVPSKLAYRSFIEEGFDPAKVSIVGYGAQAPSSGSTPRRDPDRFTVLFAGQFSVRKGAMDVLAAFRLLNAPSKKLVIAGQISDEIAHRFAAELAADDVSAVGVVARDGMRDLMSSSDILLLPSIEDGFGMVVSEAAACGCPAIVSENTGAADFIRERVNGYVVPIHSPEQIAERLQAISDDKNLGRHLSEGAIAQVGLQQGWGAYGQRMVDTYSTLLGSRHS